MTWTDYIPFVGGGNPVADVADALADAKGDADAIALFPYADGTWWFKPAYYDSELLGGKGGYETEDGDVIPADGGGTPKRELLGVPIITAADPSEHVGAIEPVKALMAHKNNIGEWLKVDRKGNVVEAGEALEAAPTSDVEPSLSDSLVGDRAQELAQQDADAAGIAPGPEHYYERAMKELESEGQLTKIVDIAPPAEPVVEDGEVDVEQATHVPLDVSKATDLLPTTINNTELQTELDKARMEEYEEGRNVKYLVYGIVIGVIIATLLVGGTGGLFAFMG